MNDTENVLRDGCTATTKNDKLYDSKFNVA